MKKSARLLAFDTLYDIFKNQSYSNLAIDSVMDNAGDDKAFVAALIYGVIERKITLDYFISLYLNQKVKPKVMMILRMGAYQLLFMDKVPSSAAINESAELAKQINQNYYVPLINAVLHKIDKSRNMPDDLSVQYSVPNSLINMWIKAYSKEKVCEFLPFINGKSPIFAVPNTLFVDANELLYELNCENVDGEVFDGLVKIDGHFDVHSSAAFKNGLFHIQDIACTKCCRALDVKQGQTVIDVCASPGGKSFTISEMMNGEGKTFAFDIHPHRVNLIKNSAKRLGLNNVFCQINDATVFNENIPMADRIICDVPCSGFGIIRKKPEIRYKDLDSIKELPSIQLNILTTSSKYLKVAGKIVYSTCTLNKKENEKVVKSFIDNNSEFTILSEKTFFPSDVGNDGFYYAVIERTQ